ncbi:unnamed protein product [Brassica rapa subsp. narinosa]|uniref:(rape) hypothetical protein n=2 Tax=Brassica TaxID=3705 RepID=A0A816X6K3_BRANA|nr:unnamed protein product [Brassica napus]
MLVLRIWRVGFEVAMVSLYCGSVEVCCSTSFSGGFLPRRRLLFPKVFSEVFCAGVDEGIPRRWFSVPFARWWDRRLLCGSGVMFKPVLEPLKVLSLTSFLAFFNSSSFVAHRCFGDFNSRLGSAFKVMAFSTWFWLCLKRFVAMVFFFNGEASRGPL